MLLKYLVSNYIADLRYIIVTTSYRNIMALGGAVGCTTQVCVYPCFEFVLNLFSSVEPTTVGVIVLCLISQRIIRIGSLKWRSDYFSLLVCSKGMYINLARSYMWRIV
jgi:hypothetical protein